MPGPQGGLVSPSLPNKPGAEDVPLDMAAIEQQIQAMLRALPRQNLEEPQVGVRRGQEVNYGSK